MNDEAAHGGLETGLQAWIAGDLDTLQTLLAPNVTLRGPEPGPFDSYCTGRDQVLLLLHDRKTTGHQPKTGRIEQVDDHTFVVTTNLSGDAGATRLTVAAGQVVQMQQRRSRRSGRHRSRRPWPPRGLPATVTGPCCTSPPTGPGTTRESRRSSTR